MAELKYIDWIYDLSDQKKKDIEEIINIKRNYHMNMKVYIDNSESIWRAEESGNTKEIAVAKHEQMMAVENDIGYVQFCQSREEINEYIKRLEQVRDACWPV